jgi:lipid-A-disaccharide synthase
VTRRLFITVAERSADQHAGNLVRALKRLDPTIEVHALGGDALRSAGAIVHHDTVSNAAMGLRAFGRAFEVKRLLRWTDEFCRQSRIDLHVCCDSWTMNVHFAKQAKARSTRVLYYIAPQAWASREGRVKKLAQVADRVACILPFEEKFFRERGVDVTYVGHPLFDELRSGGGRPWAGLEAGAVSSIRVALPCGSRGSVARANFPRQLAVAEIIRRSIPDASFVVPTTSSTDAIVRAMIEGKPYVSAKRDAFDELLPGCDLAITVSGTATLHIAAHRVPMIVVYSASKLLWHTLGRWLVKIRTYAQVNLLANDGIDDPSKHIVPEFIPWFGPVEPVANRAIAMLQSRAERDVQQKSFDKLIERIGQPGASHQVAKIVMEMLDE